MSYQPISAITSCVIPDPLSKLMAGAKHAYALPIDLNRRHTRVL